MSDRARNSIRGRKAKAAGNAFEAWCEAQHDLALRLGILARIDKIDPPAERRDGRVEFGPRTGADYIGMLGCGMRAIGDALRVYPVNVPGSGYAAIEAKSTQKEYLPRAEVKPKQQEHLDVVGRGGGLALLVVEFRYPPPAGLFLNGDFYRRYACPWATKKTAKSVTESDLLRGGWLISDKCYLMRFHPPGQPVIVTEQRRYPRE